MHYWYSNHIISVSIFRCTRCNDRERSVNVMSDATSADGAWDRRRWLILGVIGLAQLMVVLDVTVMNIALPSAQHALRFTTADRQWVVTAYTLAFGSLLLVSLIDHAHEGRAPAATAWVLGAGAAVVLGATMLIPASLPGWQRDRGLYQPLSRTCAAAAVACL